jgi:hypothetical protein
VTKYGDPSDETGKIETPFQSRFGTIKILPGSRALRAEYRIKFLSPSPVKNLHISEIFLSGT